MPSEIASSPAHWGARSSRLVSAPRTIVANRGVLRLLQAWSAHRPQRRSLPRCHGRLSCRCPASPTSRWRRRPRAGSHWSGHQSRSFLRLPGRRVHECPRCPRRWSLQWSGCPRRLGPQCIGRHDDQYARTATINESCKHHLGLPRSRRHNNGGSFVRDRPVGGDRVKCPNLWTAEARLLSVGILLEGPQPSSNNGSRATETLFVSHSLLRSKQP